MGLKESRPARQWTAAIAVASVRERKLALQMDE